MLFSLLIACTTISGPRPFAPCIFPFSYNGIIHWGCPKDPDDSRKRWCSTLVDNSGQHVSGQNQWGHCSITCPIHSSGGGVADFSYFSPGSNQIDYNYPTATNSPYISKGKHVVASTDLLAVLQYFSKKTIQFSS